MPISAPCHHDGTRAAAIRHSVTPARAQVAKNRVFRECVDKEKNQRLFGNHHRVRRPRSRLRTRLA